MGRSLTQKIIEEHLIDGNFKPGEEISLRIDQTLLQDATGTMAFLEFEQLKVKRVKVPFAIIYVDHNMLQLDHRNPDDHIFLRTFSAKYGIYYSGPGNGICHQVHLERFSTPGATLLGADSHTPMSGAVGSLAIGVGGMEVAVAMAGHPFEMSTPIIVGVHLEGKLNPWVDAKDIILEMLRRLTVHGGLNRIYEFRGPAVATLTTNQRATICNMITELGATSAIFPSDEQTLAYFNLQNRKNQWKPLSADSDAKYDEEIVINLSEIEPLIAKPHSPDNVVPVREIAGTAVAQVCIGSSVNSSYKDLAIAAAILEGKRIPLTVSMTVSPGSRQILDTITSSGVLKTLIHAGARILEPACGPCVGMGQAPSSNVVSVRTFNRNFKGRSGTINDFVHLTSPATATASALRGVITDPRDLGEFPIIKDFSPIIDDGLIFAPDDEKKAEKIEIIRGPNIKTPPRLGHLSEELSGRVLIVLGDNISTGSMAPDGAIVMADRSNVAAIAEFTFMKEDPEFPKRARVWHGGFIAAGDNYGQGSSREHAALAPLFLGVRAVFAVSFARIHRRNLIVQGMLPILIERELLSKTEVGDEWSISNIRSSLENGKSETILKTSKGNFPIKLDFSQRERAILLSGGLINYLSG